MLLRDSGKGTLMNLNELTEAQKAKVMAVKTPEELLALAKDEGYELSDDELDGVTGGWELPCVDDVPGCGSFTSE